MTEGIIQKVFRTNIQLTESLLERDYQDLVTTWIKAIEQELIKEIKKWAYENGLDSQTQIFYEDLIGETKE